MSRAVEALYLTRLRRAMAQPWWENGDWFAWACAVLDALYREERAKVVEGAD